MSNKQPPTGRNDETTDSAAAVTVPPRVYEQIDALRRSGKVNMVTEVMEGACQFGFSELREWIPSNPYAYKRGIFQGFEPSDPEAVEEIDLNSLSTSSTQPADVPERTDATSPDERQILSHLEGLIGVSDSATEYYIDGSWRDTTSTSEDAQEMKELINRAVDPQPQQAYRNALMAAGSVGQFHDITYVEGFVHDETMLVPMAHAWIEYEGSVLELTLSDESELTGSRTYFGKSFSTQVVEHQIWEVGTADRLAGSPHNSN